MHYRIIVQLVFFSLNIFCQDTETKEIQHFLQKTWNETYKNDDFPGASFAIALPNSEIVAITVGYSDKEKKIPMKSSDLLLLGSAGKTYFSAIALKLVDLGKLDLNKKVKDYIGHKDWYSNVQNANDITIKMLMNHTSGIDRYVFDKNFDSLIVNVPEKNWTVAERVKILKNKKPLFKAGSDFHYSDLNYIILGSVIEEITGEKIYSLLSSWILKPFGLKETAPSNSLRVKGLIPGYTDKHDPLGVRGKTVIDGKSIYNLQFEWTGGGVAASARDLAKWSHALYNWKVFSENRKKEFLSPAVNSKKKMRRSYGLGVFNFRIKPLGDFDIYGHSGFMPGYFTEMIYIPKFNVSFSLIMNSTVNEDTRNFFRSFITLIKAYLKKYHNV